MVAYGRDAPGVVRPVGVECRRIRGLSGMVDSGSRIAGLEALLATADVVHVQNIMNPTALAMAVERGRAVVTVQDTRASRS